MISRQTPAAALEQGNRSRNLLARVRSILRHMAETDPSAVDFAAHLEGRLSALWRAEETFASDGADLKLIFLDEFLNLQACDDAIALRGPTVRLNVKAASVIILAVHELTTNAFKFGAFAHPEGRLAVTWGVRRNGRLWLKWIESGVSIVTLAPRHEGFGYDLITRRIAYELGGKGEFTLYPGGFTCSINIPLEV